MTVTPFARSGAPGGASRRRLNADVAALAANFRALHDKGSLEIPGVGDGDTAGRHMALHAIGRTDLSLARVAEAHTDAIAILAEAGRAPTEGALYGVWAAEGPGSQLKLEAASNGEFTASGAKRYCSGCLFLDKALVTAQGTDGVMLIEVPLESDDLRMDASDWVSPAFQATATGTVEFRNVRIGREQIVGTPGWYLSRPGFWHGAMGPAACWAGGAAGLVDIAHASRRANPHNLAHLGALEASAWGMIAVLDRAGREIDADPQDGTGNGRRRALSARHLIERACTEVLDRFGRASGPALLAYDAKVAQRYAELTLYIRQCHAERDLQALAES